MQREPVYILLPPGEYFSEYNGGAVAIVVNSMSQHSDYTPTVIGDACSQPMSGAPFHPVAPFLYRLRSRSRAYAGACKAWLKRQPAGIVEVHNRIPLLMHLSGRVPQHKYCLYLHNDPQGMKGAKMAEERRQLLSKVACIYAVSEFVKNRFLDGLTEGGDKVHVLHNGIEPAVFKNYAEKEKQILFVGRIIPEKGVLQLARALKTVLPNHPDWRAVFVGARHFGNTQPTTSYEKAVLAELADLGEQVQYLNAIPHKAVMACYQRARIAVVPSIWEEPFGRTALEAMSSSCALVSSDRGGLAEVVGNDGVIIDPESPREIAAALQHLIDQPSDAERLAKQAHQRALHLFHQRVIAQQHDRFRYRLSQV